VEIAQEPAKQYFNRMILFGMANKFLASAKKFLSLKRLFKRPQQKPIFETKMDEPGSSCILTHTAESKAVAED
jgi:hypothetical protein